MLKLKRLVISGMATFGIVGFLVSCGGGDGDDGPVFNPDVPPQDVEVVSGDRFDGEVRNTISWEYDETTTDYNVYWDTVPGVTTSSDKVVPSDTGLNYIVHSGPDVYAGQTYYYRVVAVSDDQTSVPSAEVFGIPQETETPTSLNDVVWNGAGTLVTVGDSGVILTSANGTTDPWVTAGEIPTSESLAGVTWDDVNVQYLVVGAGGTVLTSADGDQWMLQESDVAIDLEDVAWTGDEYIVVGKSGTVLTSPTGEELTWEVRSIPSDLTNTTLNGVAVGGDTIVMSGTNGKIFTIHDKNLDWDELNWTVQTVGNNDLNDVTWNGSAFGIVGSNDTVLISLDGITWEERVPGTPNITFVGAVQWDSGIPVDPILAAVGSAGTLAISPDSSSGYSVPTNDVSEEVQLSAITWVDDGVNNPYFVIVGNDGTLLTNQQ
ncbi:MAG: hypothetical protein QNJ78_01985 [Gammaproteobacteria bacterium]|nr:hypothetical protein [Gammaproteobacteria bacterium]